MTRPSVSLISKSRPQPPGAFMASMVFAWRALLKMKHVPMQLFDVTAFPIMMIVLFSFLFGGALEGSVKEYLQFLIPGIAVSTVSMISMYTAMGVNSDISKGVFDRFRSLPIWRPALITGALIGDMVRYTTALVVTILLGVVLGFRPAGGFSGVVLAVLFMLFFAFCLSWLWSMVGLLLKTPEMVMQITGIASFPLVFLSNIYVDPATMPGWLQAVVNVNPISLVTNVTRGLMHGNLLLADLFWATFASLLLLAVFGPITMHLYRNKNAR